MDILKKENRLENCPGIFSFPRGGLILSCILSYKTNLPLLMNPCDNCIVIDDIIDTGITMKKYSDLRNKKNYFITSMFIKDQQWEGMGEFPCVDDFSLYVKYDDWIIFPWEDNKVQ